MIDVTTLVPACNESEMIVELLESVSRQNVNGFSLEIIVSDDGSAEATRYVRPDPYTRRIKRPRNGGKGAAVVIGSRFIAPEYTRVSYSLAQVREPGADHAVCLTQTELNTYKTELCH